MVKAVLAHVIAQPAAQRGVNLGLGRLEQGSDPLAQLRLGRRGGRRQRDAREHLHGRCSAARQLAMAGLPAAARSRRGEVDVADQQLLLELRGTGQQRAGVIDDERMAVEDEFILAADQRAEGERGGVLAGALAHHLLALAALAGVVGGGGEVHDQRRARQRKVRAGRSGLPDVLADRDPDAVLAELDQTRHSAGLEVALLVEHAVVRQADLAVDGREATVSEHRGGVVDVGRALGKTDDRDEAVGPASEPVDRGARVAQEVLLVEQVLWRVAGNRELPEQDELRPLGPRRLDRGHNCGLVGGDVADRRIELAERQAQRGHTRIIEHRPALAGGRRRSV